MLRLMLLKKEEEYMCQESQNQLKPKQNTISNPYIFNTKSVNALKHLLGRAKF